MNEVYEIFKRNFPYISREEKTLLEIINNENNYIIKKKNDKDELIGCAIVNRNTIILLVIDKEYRNQGIGTELLNKCEEYIKENNYEKIVLGVGFNYLMPGVPTSDKEVESYNENIISDVTNTASNFFKKKGYVHSWGDCNCFDMKMNLNDFNQNEYSIGDTINEVTYRWATPNDIEDIVKCCDDACQYQDEKFSKYYINKKLYDSNSNQKVLVAVKNNKIVGTLIVSIETEGKDLGCVGCTCVMFSETHQKIGTNLVKLGTKYLKDIGLKKANLSYTYSGLDKLYGASGYMISTYYFMGEKNI